MEKELENLKIEIKVLKERINYLEKKERRRTIFTIIKFLIIVFIIIIVIITIYNLYQDIVKLYEPFLIK